MSSKNHLLLLAAHICPEFPVLLVDKSSADFALRVFSKNIEKKPQHARRGFVVL